MHPDLRRDLLQLLRNPALGKVMEALHASLARHGEPKGRLRIGTREEADALEDLVGKWVKPGGSVAVREIDLRLREGTVFHCSLTEAVELHRGAPIVRPREEKARAAAARDRAIRRCFAVLPELGLSAGGYARVVGWMHAGERELRAGLRGWGEDALLRAVRAVALVLDRIPEKDGAPVFLGELANEVAGNAHALDARKPAGSLLMRALAHHYPETAGRERPRTAAWRTNLLSEAGIARDPVSVRVDTFGLMGDTPYLRELRRAALNRPLNLDDLAQIGGDVRAWRNVVFVVENPTVFSALVRRVRGTYVAAMHPTLVCTNGNLNLADRKLLAALVQSGAHLFYAGDFDAKGLQIAASVLEAYPGSASPWRMTPEDYRNALRDKQETLDPATLQRAGRHFPALAAEMGARRQAAHQEGLTDTLIRDLDAFVTRSMTPPVRGQGPGGSRAARVEG